MFATKFLQRPKAKIAYHLIENPNSQTNKACLMLHGAGVAGELTYAPLIEHLSYWRWLLVPDLNGMGQSFYHAEQEAPVSIESLTDDMLAVIEHVAWQDFDIMGYSLGGLVALNLNYQLLQTSQKTHRLILMEPASLDRECMSTLADVRKRYRTASQTIRETGDVEQGIAHFMEGVSPNRRKHPVAEATTQTRLAHRPIGFSFALDAVTDWVERMPNEPELRDQLVQAASPVLLMSGSLSHELLRNHYDLLAQTHSGWHHQPLSGCDHSLPFQKPRQIAKYTQQWLLALDIE